MPTRQQQLPPPMLHTTLRRRLIYCCCVLLLLMLGVHWLTSTTPPKPPERNSVPPGRPMSPRYLGLGGVLPAGKYTGASIRLLADCWHFRATYLLWHTLKQRPPLLRAGIAKAAATVKQGHTRTSRAQVAGNCNRLLCTVTSRAARLRPSSALQRLNTTWTAHHVGTQKRFAGDGGFSRFVVCRLAPPQALAHPVTTSCPAHSPTYPPPTHPHANQIAHRALTDLRASCTPCASAAAWCWKCWHWPPLCPCQRHLAQPISRLGTRASAKHVSERVEYRGMWGGENQGDLRSEPPCAICCVS